MKKKKRYDWILIYWMPYDNNLSSWGNSIIEMLAKGAQNENILVLVESDFYNQDLLSRSIITKGHIDTQQLEATNSASENLFSECLSWAQEQFSAEKWVITFLGHGGNLDEISPDEHPEIDTVSERQWLNTEKVSEIIADFQENLAGDVELVFLQNCCKGTIESHYTFRYTAKYTLSSQTVLGVPNYYYESLLQYLDINPEIGGGELAKKIMSFERDDMYNSYTVTRNQSVFDLPSKINPLIEAILSSNVESISVLELLNKEWSYSYLADQLMDVVSFFKEVVSRSQVNCQLLDDFTDFLTNEMIYEFQESPQNNYPNLSGLSLFVPTSKAQLEKYSYLQVFSDLHLEKFFNTVLFS